MAGKQLPPLSLLYESIVSLEPAYCSPPRSDSSHPFPSRPISCQEVLRQHARKKPFRTSFYGIERLIQTDHHARLEFGGGTHSCKLQQWHAKEVKSLQLPYKQEFVRLHHVIICVVCSPLTVRGCHVQVDIVARHKRSAYNWTKTERLWSKTLKIHKSHGLGLFATHGVPQKYTP